MTHKKKHNKYGTFTRATGEWKDIELASSISILDGYPGTGTAGSRLSDLRRVIYGHAVPNIKEKHNSIVLNEKYNRNLAEEISNSMETFRANYEAEIGREIQIREFQNRVRALEDKVASLKVSKWNEEAANSTNFFALGAKAVT